MSNKSQVYANGYEKWEGNRERALPAWYLIGMHSLKNLVSSSGCWGRMKFGSFFVIYYFWLILWAIGHYQWETLNQYPLFRGISQTMMQGGVAFTEADYHRYFILIPSIIFSCIASLFYGSQLISKDKRANAMQVYFSKAISRADYIGGKLFAVGMITGSVTLVPSTIMLVLGVILTTNHLEFFKAVWFIPLLTGSYWAVLTAMLGSLTLLFSSFFDKAYMAGVSIIGFLLFFMVFSTLMVQVVGMGDLMNGTNWLYSIYNIGEAIYKVEVENWSRLIWQLIDCFLLVGICTAGVLRNIRPVEVVS